jgi:hypothetical protein
MIVNSVPHPWVEAQDQPRKGSGEIQKSTNASLPTEFRPHNPPENHPATLRMPPVIYVHRNRSAQTAQNFQATENTARITAYGKNIMPKATT